MYQIFEPTRYLIFKPTNEPSAQPSETALVPGGRSLATNAHVRRVFLAAMTRVRNLSVVAGMGATALVMMALGMSWSGLGVLGFGTMLYAGLVTRDAVSEKFLSQFLSLEEDEEQESETEALSDCSQATLPLYGLDENMRVAYLGVLSRRAQLQEQISACPSALQASLSGSNETCATLLAHAKRLVSRGQRLHAYLEFTRLHDLLKSVPLLERQGESSKDRVAPKLYKQVITARQRHIDTHIEVEGLYDRVLAQLLLIETTLAGTIALLVKIIATDDEQSAMTAHYVTEELETLLSDVEIFESSLDEVSFQHAAVLR